MKKRPLDKEKKVPPVTTSLPAKESDQHFFGGGDTFFNKTESGGKKTGAKPVIQKKCKECEQEDKVQKKEAAPSQQQAKTTAPPANPPAQQQQQQAGQAARHFIVEDTAAPEAGQMRKSQFMARLKMEVRDSVNQALRATPFTADNCPYLQSAFARYEGSSAADIESLIRRYAPGTAGATTAEAVIQMVKGRVFIAARQWIMNKLASMIGMGAGAAGAGGAGNNTGGGGLLSGLSGMFFKSDTGSPTVSQSPQSVMSSLGKGTPMEGGTRSKMETAFGTSFAGVEIHNDAKAAQLSSGMNARAFTVGNHIAFAEGEYQPGNVVGDALIAHELAHTQQQEGGIDEKSAGNAGYGQLEEDADSAAVNAVLSMQGKKGVKDKAKMKGLKSGLRLQRCVAAPAAAVALEGGAVLGTGAAIGTTGAAVGTGAGIWSTLGVGSLVIGSSVLLESDSPRRADPCHEEMLACMLTSLADEDGSVWGEGRCVSCAASCRANGGQWPSRIPKTRGFMDCAYWNHR